MPQHTVFPLFLTATCKVTIITPISLGKETKVWRGSRTQPFWVTSRGSLHHSTMEEYSRSWLQWGGGGQPPPSPRVKETLRLNSAVTYLLPRYKLKMLNLHPLELHSKQPWEWSDFSGDSLLSSNSTFPPFTDPFPQSRGPEARCFIGEGKEGRAETEEEERECEGQQRERAGLVSWLSETETKSPGRSPCERQVCTKTLRLQSCAKGAKPPYLGSSLDQRYSSQKLVLPLPGLAPPTGQAVYKAGVFSLRIHTAAPDLTVPSTGARIIAGAGRGCCSSQ